MFVLKNFVNIIQAIILFFNFFESKFPYFFYERTVLSSYRNQSFLTNVSILYSQKTSISKCIHIIPLKTPENQRFFWCFQGVKYGNIGQKWSKYYNSNTSTMFMDMHKNIAENYDISKTSKNTFWSISCFFFFRIILWNFRKNRLPW